jgi:hypothetical protein
MIRSWLPVLALGLALTGCRMDHAAAGPVAFDLDQPFALGGGQEASINGADLRVRFTDVLEDSR